jgi:formate hydrogenlyase subunit 3/multisubunit Na+/H+ antiporter MnhD subunit
MSDVALILLALSPAVPLVMAPIALLMRDPLRMLLWGALPALLAALLSVMGEAIEIPILLLGVTLQLDRLGAVFLGFGALLWLLAGAFARQSLRTTPRPGWFAAFWLVTMAGTLGTFIAGDVVTFYLCFAVMSFAAYGLVVHERTPEARRAGRVYIVLVVVGEAALLAAFMLAAADANTYGLEGIRESLGASPWRPYILAGLLIGFGIKAGLVPLHVWLPLAHPVAPTPASAALSGIIVAAGIAGLIRFLPDAPLPVWGDLIVLIGLVTAYYGIAIGLTQSNPKVVLAYSTLSQMGILAAVLGSALSDSGVAGGAPAATLYAMHHGLAKAGLFLSVGLLGVSGAFRRPVLFITGLTALAIAGLPFSGGALAKLAIKTPLGDGATEFLVSLSAIGTTLLMLHFLARLARQESEAGPAAPGLLLPWLGTVSAALALTWALFPVLSGEPLMHAFAPGNLWSASWPILLALGIGAIWNRLVRFPLPKLPAGDLVVFGSAVSRAAVHAFRRMSAHVSGVSANPRKIAGIVRPAGVLLQSIESALERWSIAGPVLLVLVGLLILTLAAG